MKNITVSKLGKATVIVDIVKKGNFEIRPGYAMNPTQIAIHNTGNSGRGAGAKAHNIYIHNMSKLTPKDTGYASWHFSVDDKFIYQHIPLDESAWHTGDGSALTSGNRTAVGIEICMNPDMDYKQAEENAVALTAYLMKVLKVDAKFVKPHQAFSGKYCPAVILKRDGGFTPFHNRVKNAFKNLNNIKPVATKPPAAVKPATKPTTSKPSPKPVAVNSGKDGGRVESIYNGDLNFYSKPSWNKKDVAGTIKKGYGFPQIIEKVKVNTAYQYKVKNSKGAIYYITASSTYVKVVKSSNTTTKPKVEKVPTKSTSSIKSVGSIQIVNLKNFTYIYDKPNSSSRMIGEAHKNKTFKIAGSVTGWYEIIFNGRRAYVSSKYAKRI